jgi:hypothetical protein
VERKKLMITSSQILEEYHALLKTSSISVPVFFNPNRSDFREMGSDVRFIADAEEKKVYAWDASTVIHRTMKYFLGLDTVSPKMFWGEADKHGNDYICIASDSFRIAVENLLFDRRHGNDKSIYQKYVDEFLAQDWTWVDKYIDMTSYIQKVKDSIQSNNMNARISL